MQVRHFQFHNVLFIDEYLYLYTRPDSFPVEKSVSQSAPNDFN